MTNLFLRFHQIEIGLTSTHFNQYYPIKIFWKMNNGDLAAERCNIIKPDESLKIEEMKNPD